MTGTTASKPTHSRVGTLAKTACVACRRLKVSDFTTLRYLKSNQRPPPDEMCRCTESAMCTMLESWTKMRDSTGHGAPSNHHTLQFNRRHGRFGESSETETASVSLDASRGLEARCHGDSSLGSTPRFLQNAVRTIATERRNGSAHAGHEHGQATTLERHTTASYVSTLAHQLQLPIPRFVRR